MTKLKIVESAHYHLWTDALHARALAHQAENRWDRGTYVRWGMTTSWTVLEMACEIALETPGIGRRFRENLDDACSAKGLAPLDWGNGIWQRVTALHRRRVGIVHASPNNENLFPEAQVADDAISIVRSAVTDIFVRVGQTPPMWLQDDEDRGWEYGRKSEAHGQRIHKGVDPKAEDTVRISYEYKDREFDSDFYPAGTNCRAAVDTLLANLRVPVAAVRAYRGSTMIYEREVNTRGA